MEEPAFRGPTLNRMWRFFRRRREEDLPRLATAYRYYLKASDQAELDGLGDADRRDRKWRGGFGKAFQQLFHQWPTPNESRRFERNMKRRLKKSEPMDRAFVSAFNDYLNQKRLTDEEISEVMESGREAYKSGSR